MFVVGKVAIIEGEKRFKGCFFMAILFLLVFLRKFDFHETFVVVCMLVLESKLM